MMSRIEQLIGEIEEYIDGCKYQPLSNSKIVVNRDELEELLVELRLRIPDEIKQYQKIISNRDVILNEAHQQADSYSPRHPPIRMNWLTSMRSCRRHTPRPMRSSIRRIYRLRTSSRRPFPTPTISARAPSSTRTIC